MNFFYFIADHAIVMLLLAAALLLGYFIGEHGSRIRTLYLKNPFKDRESAVRDVFPMGGPGALRFKREYVINLIVKDDKDFPFDKVSDFTVNLEDMIQNGKLTANPEAFDNGSSDRQQEKNIEEFIPEVTEEDIEEMFNPQDYKQ